MILKMVNKRLIYTIAFVAVISLVTWFVYSKGKNTVQVKWDSEKRAQEQVTKEIQNKYDELYKFHKEYVEYISNQLSTKELENEERIADIERKHLDGLRKSEDRASVYRRKAEAGEAESRDLANHAAELDRSLVEGKRVAAELAATVRLRDEQIKALGTMLTTTYSIVEGSDK